MSGSVWRCPPCVSAPGARPRPTHSIEEAVQRLRAKYGDAWVGHQEVPTRVAPDDAHTTAADNEITSTSDADGSLLPSSSVAAACVEQEEVYSEVHRDRGDSGAAWPPAAEAAVADAAPAADVVGAHATAVAGPRATAVAGADTDILSAAVTTDVAAAAAAAAVTTTSTDAREERGDQKGAGDTDVLSGWCRARPVGVSVEDLDETTARHQLEQLRRARALVQEFTSASASATAPSPPRLSSGRSSGRNSGGRLPSFSAAPSPQQSPMASPKSVPKASPSSLSLPACGEPELDADDPLDSPRPGGDDGPASSRDAGWDRAGRAVRCTDVPDGFTMSFRIHALSHAALEFDFRFCGTWQAMFTIRIDGLGTGVLPLIALAHEPDLLAAYLPRAAGLPHLESLSFGKVFAPNDWVYHGYVSPWGPFPGADDVHGCLLVDLLDEQERAILFYMESPAKDCKAYRGWQVPPVKSWRRVRNILLGSATLIRPSTLPAVTIEPPTPRPERCATPGCKFRANSALSLGGGRYCCARCRDRPGKHSSSCERCRSDGSTPAEWALATQGSVDLETHLRLILPIPRWLIPTSLVKWVVPKLVRLIYPLLLLLNERFPSTPFAARVAQAGRLSPLPATALPYPPRPPRHGAAPLSPFAPCHARRTATAFTLEWPNASSHTAARAPHASGSRSRGRCRPVGAVRGKGRPQSPNFEQIPATCSLLSRQPCCVESSVRRARTVAHALLTQRAAHTRHAGGIHAQEVVGCSYADPNPKK